MHFLSRLAIATCAAACIALLTAPSAIACVQRAVFYGEDLIELMAATEVTQVVQYETIDAVGRTSDSTAGVVVAVTGYWGEAADPEAKRHGPLPRVDEIGCGNDIPFETGVGDHSYWITLGGGFPQPIKNVTPAEILSLDEAFGPMNPVAPPADELAAAGQSLREAASTGLSWKLLLTLGMVAAVGSHLLRSHLRRKED